MSKFGHSISVLYLNLNIYDVNIQHILSKQLTLSVPKSKSEKEITISVFITVGYLSLSDPFYTPSGGYLEWQYNSISMRWIEFDLVLYGSSVERMKERREDKIHFVLIAPDVDECHFP